MRFFHNLEQEWMDGLSLNVSIFFFFFCCLTLVNCLLSSSVCRYINWADLALRSKTPWDVSEPWSAVTARPPTGEVTNIDFLHLLTAGISHAACELSNLETEVSGAKRKRKKKPSKDKPSSLNSSGFRKDWVVTGGSHPAHVCDYTGRISVWTGWDSPNLRL